jgi:hypothetical protein
MSRRWLVALLVILGCGLAVLLLRDRAGLGDAASPTRGVSAHGADEGELQPPVAQDPPTESRAPITDASPTTASPPSNDAAVDHPVVVVTDSQGTTVSDAVVEITGEGPLGSHRTDSQGRCPLPVKVGNGSVQLRISAPGFVSQGIRYSTAPEIPITLDRALVVHGRVLDSVSSAPIAGASLRWSAIGVGEQPSLLGASDGRFEVASVPAGKSCTWYVTAPDYATKREERTVIGGDRELTFVLERGVPTEFEVVDAADGSPIRGAVAERFGDRISSDTAGRIATSSFLAAGESAASFSVEADGFCTLHAIVRPGDAAPSRPLRLTLVRGVALEGVVKFTDGVAVRHAMVRLDYERNWRNRDARKVPAGIELPEGWSIEGQVRSQSAQTADDGQFVFRGLEPVSENYRLVIFGPDHDATVREIGLTAEPGMTTSIEVILPVVGAVGIVNGKVTLNGEPCLGSVAWKGATRSGSAGLEHGTFHLESVECGAVTIRAEILGFEWSERCRHLIEEGKQVTVGTDVPVVADIALSIPTAVIGGRVLGPDGSPAVDVEVTAYSRDACMYARAKSAADGQFAFQVDRGVDSYVVEAGHGAASISIDQVAPGRQDLELRLHATARLRLRVTDRDSREPTVAFHLRFRRDGGEQQFDSQIPMGPSPLRVDENGWYLIELAQGRYELLVSDSLRPTVEYLPSAPLIVDVSPTAPPIEVEREKGRECVVQLAPDQQAWPADTYTVLLLESRWSNDVEIDGSNWRVAPSLEGYQLHASRIVRFDRDGTARITRLGDGPYRFMVFPPTMSISPAEIASVPAGGEPMVIRWAKN